MEGLGGPLKGLGVVKRPTWTSGKGWEAYPEVWERSRGPPEDPGSVGSPTWMTRSGQEAHPKVRGGREAHPEVQEGSRRPPECLRWVGSQTRRLVVSPASPGGVERPTRRSRGVGRPTQKLGRGWEAKPMVSEGPRDPPEGS